MSEKDDYQRLASQFVDIWQKNMAVMMNDSEFIRAFLHMMQSSSSVTKENTAYGKFFTDKDTTGAPASPDPRDAAIAGIKVSVAAIEERLGALEQAFTRFMSTPAGKASKSMARVAKRPKTGKGGRSGSGKKNV